MSLQTATILAPDHPEDVYLPTGATQLYDVTDRFATTAMALPVAVLGYVSP